MKQILALALLLTLPLLHACSSTSSKAVTGPTTNLGIVEMADRETRHYPLSGGRDCEIKFTALADGGVLVEAIVLRKDSQGNSTVLTRPRTTARFGQNVTLPIDDGNILLTPKLK